MTTFYQCNPELFEKCKKTHCQKECTLTTIKEYAKTDEFGNLIIAISNNLYINEEALKYIQQKLNERKISIPIDRDFTEDHKVGWKDGVLWRDILEIFEEMGGER